MRRYVWKDFLILIPIYKIWEQGGVGLYADDVGGNFYEQVYLNWGSLYSLGGRQFLRRKRKTKV